MHEVIRRVVDDGEFLEVQAALGREHLICGYARLGGYPVGVVANQPRALAGVLDIVAARSRAPASSAPATPSTSRWSRSSTSRVSCPGTDQEWGGIIRHGAKLLYAYCEATVPKLAVITRKAYGGAYDVMSSKHVGADFNFAWPTAEVAVMGPDGAVNIVFRKELETADDPDARRAELVEEYREQFANPFTAAERGYVDDVIAPPAHAAGAHHRARGERRQADRPARAASTATSRCERRADRRHPGADAEEKEAIRRALAGPWPCRAGAPDPPANPGRYRADAA